MSRRDKLILVAKAAALVIVLILLRSWTSRLIETTNLLIQAHRYTVVVVYWGVILAAFVGFVVAPFLRSPLARIPILVFLLIGTACDLIILDLTSVHLDGEMVAILWHGLHMAGSVVPGYAGLIGKDVAVVCVLGVILCAPPPRSWQFGAFATAIPVTSMAAIAFIIPYTKGALEDFPPPYSVIPLSIFVSAATTAYDQTYDNRKPHEVQYSETPRPLFKKIVLIMDESVRGDYLTLNNPAIDSTPFLASYRNHLANFGVAVSGANCSYLARYMFRHGVRAWQVHSTVKLREGLDQPTIWQFAHRAGFKTVFFDGMRGSISLRDGMNVYEMKYIDQKIPVNDNPSYRRDHIIADKLIELLKDDSPAFIYVDKWGVHVPYEDKFPPEATRFQPPANGTDREAMISVYKNALEWSVDDFFRKLLPALDLSDTLIIYTSDHGQSMWDGGYINQHCTLGKNVVPGESFVPLFTATTSPVMDQALREGARNGYDYASHYDIFPTMLWAMGYDKFWIARNYGPTLLNVPNDEKRGFLTGVVKSKNPMIVTKDPQYLPVDPKSFAASRKAATAANNPL